MVGSLTLCLFDHSFTEVFRLCSSCLMFTNTFLKVGGPFIYEMSIFHVIQMYLGGIKCMLAQKINRGTKCLCCGIIPRLSGL